MIITKPSVKIEVLLGGVVTTNELQLYAAYFDQPTTNFSTGENRILTNGVTPVELVPGLLPTYRREVRYLSVYNSDTVAATVTIRFNDGTNTTIIQKVVGLPSGYTIYYEYGVGWTVYTASGSVLAGSSTVADGDYGDIVISGSGLVYTLKVSINKAITGIWSFVSNKLWLYNAAQTFYHEFVSSATVNRVWTLPDEAAATFASRAYADALVIDSIADADTTHAPSRNAVFDALALKENAITAGTTAQYWRGDKVFADFNAAVDSRVQAYTGDVTLSGTAFAIGALKVTNGMLAGSIADSKLANSYIYADGTRALTGNWAAGAFQISAANIVTIGSITSTFEDSTDDNTAQFPLTLKRSRSSVTAPGGAAFAAGLNFSLEGFTPGSSASAGNIRVGWNQAQANDTTSRDSFMLFNVMINNAAVSAMRIDPSGNTFFGGSTVATAMVHIAAGAAAASSAPLKFTSGTNLTAAEAGTHEYNGNHYLSNATLRFTSGGVLPFDNFADVSVGGAETDIYSATLLASTFNVNGDKIISTYGGNFVTVGTELTQLKVYFAGTAIWDSTGVAPATGTTSWRVRVELIRVSSTVVRYNVSLNTTGATGYVYCTVAELTGLTLSGTNILKITGTSTGVGSGAGDIVGKMSFTEFKPV